MKFMVGWHGGMIVWSLVNDDPILGIVATAGFSVACSYLALHAHTNA